MKPKLLITLGCSWTEGLGCYINPFPYDTKNRLSNEYLRDIVQSRLKSEKQNFHKNSWPNRVGKKLGFDKVINLGNIASSNSHHIKLFYQFLEKNSLKEYSVLVIWLMTEPTRFSFFINRNIKDYQPSFPKKQTFADYYLNELVDINVDPILEQKFYLQSLENICKNNDIYLITTSWHCTFPYLYKYYNSKTYLHKKSIIMEPPKQKDSNGYLINYSFCFHPNENGYEWIANEMVRGIKENHPNWYSETPNENIEWEWKGKYIQDSKIIL